MTKAEKELIEAAVKWEEWSWVAASARRWCKCRACILTHAIRRVVKERRGK